MKLTREENQKIVLGALLVIGAVYGYFEYLIGPLKQKQRHAQAAAEAIVPEISKAKGQLAKFKGYEAQEPRAKVVIDQVNAMIPDGAPVAWFPSRMTDFFRKNGIERTQTRMNAESVDKELPGYKRVAWNIEFQRADFVALGTGLALLENEEPLIEISGVQIEAGREEPGNQRASLTLSNLVRQ